jgi:hypothetical protein
MCRTCGIIDDDLWQAVQDRLAARSKKHGDTGQFPFWTHQRARYLFSGLSKCGCCGGGFSMIGATALGCSTARNRGTCANLKTFHRDRLEERVLAALRDKLMDPALFKIFCEEFTREMNRLRIEASATIEAARAEIGRIDRQMQKLMQALLNETMPEKAIREQSHSLHARKQDLERVLADAVEPPLLHPEMASFYRAQVAQLHEALHDDGAPARLRAAEAIRSLVDKIVLTPTADGEMTIDVYGAIAGILHVAANGAGASRRKAAGTAPFGEQVKWVAGGGFEPPTFRL